MKNQTNQYRRTILPATIVMAILLGALTSTFAQKGIGAKYGARDPRTCADTKIPSKGAISAAQATKYVICNQEGVQGDLLYLVENVQVEVGGSRPYNYYNDSYATSIDTTAPVYPIRGSFKKYQCGKVSDYMQNAGKNCTLYPTPKAIGKCYKTTFGDWFCNMQDSEDVERRVFKLPPPTGETENNADNQPAEDKSQSAKSARPVQKDRLIYALKTNKLTSEQIITVIKANKVNFQLTDEIETELRKAGATDALIEAIRENYQEDN